MALFYGLKYTKAIQDILNTLGGSFACKYSGQSVPKLGTIIERTVSREVPIWKSRGLTPMQAAICAIGRMIAICEVNEEEMNGTAGVVSIALRQALSDLVPTHGHAEFVDAMRSWCDEQAENA